MNHDFTDFELLSLLEAARVALADAETFDMIAEQMDIQDSEMSALQEKLIDFLERA